jgi:hypothetical protein
MDENKGAFFKNQNIIKRGQGYLLRPLMDIDFMPYSN